MSNYHTPLPGSPELQGANADADVISNIEALLRDDDEEGQPSQAHFFVVSSPSTPMNPRISSLTSTMNSAAVPFRPRGDAMTEGLFAPSFTPYAPVHMSGATPPRTSALRDVTRAGFISFQALEPYTAHHYTVIVNNLDPRTQSKHLMTIFFPLGAVDALAFQSPVGTEEMGSTYAGRKGGVVLFTSQEMAVMASQKIDDFVPHGQTLPLHTAYFGRFEDYLANKDTYVMERPTDVAQQKLQEEANAALAKQAESTRQLVSVFLKAAAHSTEECDKALDAVSNKLAKDPIRWAPTIITVCAAIHNQQESLPYAQHFLRGLSKFVIQTGLMNPTTPPDAKEACGTICGAMFALQIVRGNPYGMALRITSELLDTNGQPLTEAQRSTLEALITMGAVWRERVDTPAAAPRTDVEIQFEAYVQRFKDEGRYSAESSNAAPSALPACASANTTLSAEEDGGDATNVNTSTATEVRSVGSFLVTTQRALPLCGATGNHNISIESNGSSVGPRFSSVHQTPEKRTLIMDSMAVSPPFHTSLLSALEGSTLRQHLMASTVYMTKVPMTLLHSTLRKLFECFGEFNKVRIYEEKKGAPRSAHSLTNSATRGNFGFVEFVIPASSKAMVDFFRNPSTTVQQKLNISEAEMEAILTMRVSYARSCIHDHDPDDAVFDSSDVSAADADSPGRKIRQCTFGLDY